MPEDYRSWFSEFQYCVQESRSQVVLASNDSMVMLHWNIGRHLLEKYSAHDWDAHLIDRLSVDLHEAFPEMKGFSPRNLKNMRAFAAAWPDPLVVRQRLTHLSWRHNITLLEQVDSPVDRLWYSGEARTYGWSTAILAFQIEIRAHLRRGEAQTGLPRVLPPPDSDAAVQIFKDPYLFDFLVTATARREAEVQAGLVAHIQRYLLELGQGFAFVGRQVHLEIGDSDFYLDLLFYHLRLRRFVVVAVKARKFELGDGSELGMYMNAVDRQLSHPDDKPTLGLLLVRESNRVLVEYSLSCQRAPVSATEWDTQLADALPYDLQASLPTVEEIEVELARVEERMTAQPLDRQDVSNGAG